MGQALLSAEGTRDVPLRHHTLHDAIEWRYALLSAAEQAAFLHLGVFVGRWTLEAAEAVIPKREPDPPTWRKRRCVVRLTPEHTTLRRHHDAGHRTLEFWSPPRRVRSGCRPSCITQPPKKAAVRRLLKPGSLVVSASAFSVATRHTKAQEHLTTAARMYREMDMGFWLEKAEAALSKSVPRAGR